jgi:hypothetical protein
MVWFKTRLKILPILTREHYTTLLHLYNNLYNNLAKPFCTVCAVSISSQTNGPRPPQFLQADSKLDVEGRRHKKI